MGTKKLGLLIMFFTFLHIFELSSPLHEALLSEALQDIQPSNQEMDKHQNGITGVNSDHNHGRNSVAHRSKIARGGPAGTEGGRSTGSGENGKTDAGGAGSNRHPNTRHGTSSSNQNCIGLLALISTAFASLFLLYTDY